jgi:hypothetical protein
MMPVDAEFAAQRRSWQAGAALYFSRPVETAVGNPRIVAARTPERTIAVR